MSDQGERVDPGLVQSVDELERRIKLLVTRQEQLAAHVSEALASRRPDGPDPVELERRVRSLVAERDRLAKHSEFLESRIRELLTRARYAVDA